MAQYGLVMLEIVQADGDWDTYKEVCWPSWNGEWFDLSAADLALLRKFPHLMSKICGSNWLLIRKDAPEADYMKVFRKAALAEEDRQAEEQANWQEKQEARKAKAKVRREQKQREFFMQMKQKFESNTDLPPLLPSDKHM